MSKTVLIAGASGQDGYFLSQKLKKKKIRIIGLSRKKIKLNYLDNVIKTNYNEAHLKTLIKKFKPFIIYNFAGESNPRESWISPLKKQNSITRINLNFINAILEINKKIKYFHASSSEIYGSSKKKINETSAYSPRNPYGCFKLSAHLTLKVYRDKYNLFLVNGILFNHESSRRKKKFLTSTIINGARNIKKGIKKKLILDTPHPVRDFAHAEDAVDVIELIMRLRKPKDFIISGGNIYSVKKLAETIFLKLGVNKNKIYFRGFSGKDDIKIGDTSKLRKLTKWKPKYSNQNFIEKIINE